MSLRHDSLLIALDVRQAVSEVRIGHRRDETVRPVEIIRRNLTRRICEVIRCRRDIRIERDRRIKCIGTEGEPLDHSRLLRDIRTDLKQRHEVVAVDADRAVHAALSGIAVRAVRIVLRPLIVRGQHILDVLRRDLPLRDHTPRNIIALRSILSVRAVPADRLRIEPALHEPRARCIVDMVRVIAASEHISRIK